MRTGQVSQQVSWTSPAGLGPALGLLLAEPAEGPLLDFPLMCSTGLLFCPFLNGKCEAWPPEGMRGGGERTLLTSPADRKPAPGESRGSRFPLPALLSSCRALGVGLAGPDPWAVLGPSFHSLWFVPLR